jgi:hypothetical protein
MSACPKFDYDYDYVPAAGGDDARETARPRRSHPPTASPLAWWHKALHFLALLGFLGFCVLFGLLWFALTIEAG